MQADHTAALPLHRRLRTWAGKLWRLCHPRTRSEWLTRRRYGDEHFQGPTHTAPDRFPILFEQCRQSLQTIPAPRVLSFGCATGEEVFSLAKYLPEAEIVGVDINHWCLRQCARRNANPRLRFLHRHSKEFEQTGGFDAIFCMAVFQRAENRAPGTDRITQGFMFSVFEKEILLLDNKLKAGGLLFLEHCDFRFEDTEASRHYEPLPGEANLRLSKHPVFAKDNVFFAKEHMANRVFVKR